MAETAGPAAREIATLFWILLAVGAAVYLIVLALFLVPLVRGRRRSEGDDRGDVPSPTARRWVVTGAALPAVILPGVLAISVLTMRDLPAADAESVVINVVAKQFWWSVEYEGTDAVVANEVHIPVDEPVELRLTSSDVIHAFWVVELAGKRDALPDGTTVLVIEADEPGVYDGECAEFCGLLHAKMPVFVVAHPRAEFEAWLDRQAERASSPQSEEEAQGREVFRAEGCGDCHTIRGEVTASEGDAPELTHFGRRRSVAASRVTNDAEHLAEWIVEPGSIKEGTRMPSTQLSDEELDALVTYLRSLR